MERGHALDRRRFLRTSALAAAGTLLAACGRATIGSSPTERATEGPRSANPTTTGRQISTTKATSAPAGTAAAPRRLDFQVARPLSPPSSFKESPQLASLVKAGKLPPIEKRLPENPYVVPHEWLKPGKYSGTMHWICSDTSDWATTHHVQESMYGHSPLRWLKDGLEIGLGLAESWEASEDQSEWTFHFRKGLKWSDGAPWTVNDILFWWEDEVGVPELNQSPPDDFLSGKGTPATLRKVDDYTLAVKFDAPSPLFAERAAMWTKRGIGPQWMDPKHYMQQFHIKYNKKLNPKKWTDNFFAKQDWATNPDNPVMTGWKLKQYKKGQYSVWERNPYYWCIDRWGHQLPFIDGIVMTNVQDPQVMRLNIQQGKADWVHGAFVGLTLADVSTIKSSQSKNQLDIRYWDSGSGTGFNILWNYDYAEPKVRRVIRDPRFRKAMSHAFDRARIRKVVYYNTGEPTTGTYSPKCLQFHVGKGPRVYLDWRDSAVTYDPEGARRTLDELGLKDVNGDGWRELPDGSPLRVTLDYPGSSMPSASDPFELLAKDWQAVGVNAKPNPINPTAYETLWESGKAMTKQWECSGSMGIVISPVWMMPIEPSRWAPLEGQWYALKATGKDKQELNTDPWHRHPPRVAPERGGPIDRLLRLYEAARVEVDPVQRNNMCWEMIRIHEEYGPFFMGSVANTPQMELVRLGLGNVPRREDLAQHGFVNDWEYPTPAAYDPEAWYWENPSGRA